MSFQSTLCISEIRYINDIKEYFKKSDKRKEQRRLGGASRLFMREQLPLHGEINLVFIKIFQLLLLGEI